VTVALIVLTFGFFLLLFGANPDAAFAEWVYRSLDRVMAPFRGLFEPVRLDGRSVLDVSIVFAMIVYAIVAMALQAVIEWLTARIRAHQALTTSAPSATATVIARASGLLQSPGSIGVASGRSHRTSPEEKKRVRRRAGCSRRRRQSRVT
jgi:uncharacterized protein YggT (Ycf19 family)